MSILQSIRDKFAKRAESDGETYRKLLRLSAERALTTAEQSSLEAAIDRLNVPVSQIAADEKIIGDFNAAKAASAKLAESRKASEAAWTTLRRHCDETAKIKAEFEARMRTRAEAQTALENTATLADKTVDAAEKADDRQRLMAHRHAELLGLPPTEKATLISPAGNEYTPGRQAYIDHGLTPPPPPAEPKPRQKTQTTSRRIGGIGVEITETVTAVA